MNEFSDPNETATPTEPTTVEPEAQQSAFPWPPRPGVGVFSAFVDTWVESVFRPSSFFAAMPQRGFASALAYYLPVAVIGSGLMLFWKGVGIALGYADIVNTFEGGPFDPSRALVSFLLSPLSSTVYLVIAAALTHVGLKMLGAARHPYIATLRLTAFATGPEFFLVVPLLGIPVSFIWIFVLTVVGIKAVHGTSTGRAIAALVLPIVLLMILMTLVFMAGMFGLLAIGPR